MSPLHNSKPYPEWIVSLGEVGAAKIEETKEHKGFLLPVDRERFFDLSVWGRSKKKRKNRYPQLPPKEENALLTSILENGVEVRVALDGNTFDVADGNHRLHLLRAARETQKAIPFAGFEIINFESEAEIADYEDRRASLSRKPLNRRQKREKIKEVLFRHPNWSGSLIASQLGTTGDTVASVSDKLEAEGALERPDYRVGQDGRQQRFIAPRYKGRKNREGESTDKSVESENEAEEGGILSPEARRLLSTWWSRRRVITTFASDLIDLIDRENLVFEDGVNIEDLPTLRSKEVKIGKWCQRIKGISFQGKTLVYRTLKGCHRAYQLLPDEYLDSFRLYYSIDGSDHGDYKLS